MASPPSSVVAINKDEMMIFGGSSHSVYTFNTKAGDASGFKVNAQKLREKGDFC
jgi:hypothetical protein